MASVATTSSRSIWWMGQRVPASVSAPCSSSLRARRWPRNPAPPVISTFMCLGAWSLKDGKKGRSAVDHLCGGEPDRDGAHHEHSRQHEHAGLRGLGQVLEVADRKSTRLNSSHL